MWIVFVIRTPVLEVLGSDEDFPDRCSLHSDDVCRALADEVTRRSHHSDQSASRPLASFSSHVTRKGVTRAFWTTAADQEWSDAR